MEDFSVGIQIPVVYVVCYDLSDEVHGYLRLFSNQCAAEKCRDYYISTGKYGKVFIDEVYVFDSFSKYDNGF